MRLKVFSLAVVLGAALIGAGPGHAQLFINSSAPARRQGAAVRAGGHRSAPRPRRATAPARFRYRNPVGAPSQGTWGRTRTAVRTRAARVTTFAPKRRAWAGTAGAAYRPYAKYGRRKAVSPAPPKIRAASTPILPPSPVSSPPVAPAAGEKGTPAPTVQPERVNVSETTAPVPPAPHDVAAAAPVKTPELTSKRTKPKRTGQGTPPTHHGKASSSHSGPSAVGKASHVAVSASKAKPFLQDYKDPKKSENDLPMGKVLLDLVLKLIVVLGIAWVAIYVLSKFKGSGGPLPGRKGHMKVLESVNLGPNRSVHLVRVGEKVLVVGSTPEQVNTLGEVDDPALRDELMQDRSPFSFNAHLNDALKRGDEPPKRGDAPHDLAGNVQGGAKHIWGRVQEIRGLGGGKGGSG